MPTKAQTEQRTKALKPFKKGELSSEEAARRGSIGGKASVEARKEKKIMKDEILKRLTEKDWDEMILNAIERAKNNSKDLEVLRDTIGQKPAQDVNLATESEIVIKVGLKDD